MQSKDRAQKTVGLIQINNSFADSVYLPYSVGLFQAHYLAYGQHKAHVSFLEPIFERVSVSSAVERLRDCDLIALSVYAWNFTLSLAIASEVKKVNPNTVILVGGPQIPPDPEAFLARHPAVDITCRGEGERIFTAVVDHLFDGDFSSIPSICWRDNGIIRTSETFERIENLDEIPSPYLSGVFDQLLQKYPKKQWLGLWETNRGCPFSCAFCDWGAPEQRKVFHFDPQRVKDELQWFSEHHIEFIFCCDSNFGMFKKDVEYAEFAAQLKKNTGYPHALSVQNAKNATERVIRVQETLFESGLNRGVTLALQSATPEVLTNIGRKNIPAASFAELQRAFSRKGIYTYTDIILCLPGETHESFIRGVDTIIDNGQYNRIQFINLSILPNSSMADPEYTRRFGLETVDSACMNIHGAVTDSDAVEEKQQLVIASFAMPRADWRRTRAWCWMCSFLFFDKLLQIPLTLLSQQTSTPISALVSAFLDADANEYPLIGEMAHFYHEQAASIQNGGPEYVHAPSYLDISWFQDEYWFIRLSVDGELGRFYAEAERLLRASCGLPDDRDMLADALMLNRALMKVYDETQPETLPLRWNIWDYFRGLVEGRDLALTAGEYAYIIRRTADWDTLDEWLTRVVWRGNKPGAYWWPVGGEDRHELER